MNNDCVIYDRECIECGECDICDLDEAKYCDNCGKCINNTGEFRSINIKDFIKKQEQKKGRQQ